MKPRLVLRGALTFQVKDRAAAGRSGRFTTPHGTVTTPTLMPVVNPNLMTVSPSELRERFGCEIVITNSYVLRRHEALRERALADGVHRLLGWDGPVMTDSGTFQDYVYGDASLDPIETVQFQRDIGVDVLTCVDRFVTPEMGRAEAQQAVDQTVARTREAVAHKGASLLNATVQGGIHFDLRQDCAAAYRGLDVDYHTIGGVVPLMEGQRYIELIQAILHSQAQLRKDRPVHLFGAGHPLVFPIAVALGCDLFDSSSYAKYAKDGRLMVPEGTLRLEDIDEWPITGPMAQRWTPRELLAAPPDERTRELALWNLDVCFAELRRVRQAIRDGTLWELVEQRAAGHPLLAAATRRLGDPVFRDWLERREPQSAARALRYTGHLTHRRPIFERIRRRLQERVVPQGVAEVVEEDGDWAKAGDEKIPLAMHKEPPEKPFGPRLGRLDPDQDHAVLCALGPVPLGLDEAYPFAQSVVPRLDGLDREHMGWVGETKDLMLAAHGFVPSLPGPPQGGRSADVARLQVVRTADWQFGRGAGAALTDGELRLEASPRTGKLRTVHLDGEHVLSLRAGDGFFTLRAPGARRLLAALPAPANRVVVADDSVPFNREGRNVFSHFVVSCDPALRPGDECLVVDRRDALVAVGRMVLMDEEIADFRSGVAVKVREGVAG